MGKYDDIIDHPHHRSDKHTQMSAISRAAQFSPFAALTGFGAAIAEGARLTDDKVELSDDELAVFNARLALLAEHISEKPHITITYFVPDTKKPGGKYSQLTGNIKKIDDVAKCIVFTDRRTVALNDIIMLDGGIFEEYGV